MTTIPQLPLVVEVGAGDLLPLSQSGVLYAATAAQLVNGLQPEITLPTGTLLGRVSTGQGAPEAVNLGLGLNLTSGILSANGSDHTAFPIQAAMSLTDQVVMTTGGKPALLEVSNLRGLFSAGTGITIDSAGIIGVTVSEIAGPTGVQGPAGPTGPQGVAGPQGAQGAGLTAPATGNSANSISGSDYVAIWQNGANSWITYQQLIGGQTIDQLPSAGPAQDSDQILVAQGSNSLSSQSFAAIWAYIINKLPTMKTAIVELTTNTVLDGTSHNGRILIASQPLSLSANFTNMGSGFSCRIINLSSGAIIMGAGITAGSGTNILTAGTEAVLTGLTYSGGSIVWWSGIASSTPSLTVAPIVVMAVSTSFSVSGNFYNDIPASLDYSFDGISWTAASSPVISSDSYSFQVPGLPAGIYVLHVRDHANISIVGTSNSFDVINFNIKFLSTPSTMSVGMPITVNGSVVPSNAAVQIGISSSINTPPANFISASVVLGSWSASVTPGTSGTAYLWAQQTDDPAISVVSSAISIANAALTVSAPNSATVGQAFMATGTVAPAGSAVTIQIEAQDTTAPSSPGTSATVTGGNFSGSLTPTTAGNFYVWAQDQSGLAAVSSQIAVAAQSSVSYTVNQPGTTSYPHGSGTIAVNGSVNPPQNIATQVAVSTSNTNPPTTGWEPASIIDNNALWALYLTSPANAGSYYIWVESTSGTGAAVSTFTLTIT